MALLFPTGLEVPVRLGMYTSNCTLMLIPEEWKHNHRKTPTSILPISKTKRTEMYLNRSVFRQTLVHLQHGNFGISKVKGKN